MDNLAADFEINPNNPLNAEYELGEGVGFDCSFELFASGTVWGNIDGDINNQTDLINLLNTKVDLTSFEELSTTVTNNYNELTGDIANLTTTVTDNYNTLSGQISDLTGVVNDNYTSLDNRLTTAEGSILNLTDTVNNNYTELNGKITTTNNNLSTLSQTVEDNNTAINSRVDGIVDSFDGDISDLNDAIDNLSDTVSDNYTDLNDKITDNTDDITTIQNTINSYGDIVSYNAVYFATANQGALADSALQPNDNISELVNDVGYITSASLPTVNNATITIQKNGADVGTFTLNQANNDTLNITVPTQASDIGAMPDTTTIEDLTTIAQLNALNSGATTSNIGQITTNQNNIADIRSLIPLQASTSNQLADKGFVNSSIATNTANFIGTFNSVAELEAYSGPLTNNDYAFVATTDSAGNTLYDRYKYNADTQQWIFEYELNNSSFTAQQWASINSGITSGDVTLIGTALQPNDNISELVNDAGYITSSALTNYVTTNTNQSISGTKTFGTISVANITNTSNTTILRTYAGNTEVGTTNTSLLLKSNLERPYFNNISNTLALSSDIPTVNNGTLDIQVNGTSVGTFTANQSGNTTANIVVPDSATWGNITGTLSNQTDLQNALNSKYDASNPNGYITSSDLPTNYVTTDTAQDISGRKTFLGEKAIYFKQTVTTDKLGFTLYNPSNSELGALEWRPNTINGNALLALNCPQSGSNYVGFRYWSGINIVAPRPTTNGNYYIPVNVTDGTNTVTANNNGTLNISSLLPDVSDMATQTWVTSQNYVNGTTLTNTLTNYVTDSVLTTTLADYTLASSLSTVATTGDYDDLTNKPTIPTVNNGTLTIQKNGTTVGTFTANDTNNVTANISVPTSISDLTDDTSTYPIDKAESVVDNNSGNLNFWSGTKAQYDAIVTKDANTLYNVEDTTSPIISILDSLYPVGSIYIGTMSACPLQTLGVGTWQLVATDKVLQGAGTRGVVGDTLNESLPNHTHTVSGDDLRLKSSTNGDNAVLGAGGSLVGWGIATTTNNAGNAKLYVAGSTSGTTNATYQNNAPVQQDAYLVNIWERIS